MLFAAGGSRGVSVKICLEINRSMMTLNHFLITSMLYLSILESFVVLYQSGGHVRDSSGESHACSISEEIQKQPNIHGIHGLDLSSRPRSIQNVTGNTFAEIVLVSKAGSGHRTQAM